MVTVGHKSNVHSYTHKLTLWVWLLLIPFHQLSVSFASNRPPPGNRSCVFLLLDLCPFQEISASIYEGGRRNWDICAAAAAAKGKVDSMMWVKKHFLCGIHWWFPGPKLLQAVFRARFTLSQLVKWQRDDLETVREIAIEGVFECSLLYGENQCCVGEIISDIRLCRFNIKYFAQYTVIKESTL